MNNINGFMLENYVEKVFREAGYLVQSEKAENDRDRSKYVDIVVKKELRKYCVEIKFSKIIESGVQEICDIAEEYKMIPILITFQNIKEEKRDYYYKKYPGLILIDIKNLLYTVKDNPKLYNELVAMLPYSIDNIEPQKGFINLDSIQHDDYVSSLIKEIKLCQSGKLSFVAYEELCCKLLKNIFSEDLALWRSQQKSNKDLYRFDLLCRIKDGNQKTFWSILERYFNSKYIIFEFKNYSKPITQKEIYTTERYLYSKALRGVAIVIAANGYEENAYWATKGSLRENGKLIMLFDTEDLIAMNKMKMEQEDPANYLLNKLDDLLLNLEK